MHHRLLRRAWIAQQLDKLPAVEGAQPPLLCHHLLALVDGDQFTCWAEALRFEDPGLQKFKHPTSPLTLFAGLGEQAGVSHYERA